MKGLGAVTRTGCIMVLLVVVVSLSACGVSNSCADVLGAASAPLACSQPGNGPELTFPVQDPATSVMQALQR